MPRLSDLSLKNLPVPAKGQATYDDEGSPLKVRVSQGGSNTFLVMVGSGRRHRIGLYGEVTLAQARAAAIRLKAEKSLGRVFPEAMSLATARDLYLSQIDVRPKTREYYVYHLNKLKAAQVRDVTTRDVTRVLDQLPPPSRTQALATFRPFFKWCVARNYADKSPCEKLTAHKSTARDRVLTDHELRLIWQACEPSTVLPHGLTSRSASTDNSKEGAERCAQPISPTFAAIVKLLILTGCRKSEIANIQTSWIRENCLTIPKEFCKNGREHSFPLGPFSSTLIATISRSSGTKSYLFPARGSGTPGKPFNGFSKSKAALDRNLAPHFASWTLHDLRRTFATNLAALGVRMEVTERLLNHVSGPSQGGIIGVYQRHHFKDEMREAAELWEKRLLKIVDGPA